MSGVSGGMVSAIGQELKALMPLYRNTGSDLCVALGAWHT
jgi:hypothetical protein